MALYHLFFYKSGALIVSINLLTGEYFLPTIDSSRKEMSVRDIKSEIKRKYHVVVDDYDLIDIDYSKYLFIGEWEGTYSLDDDALRSKWIEISEFTEPEILEIRKRYRDIVDKRGETIAIATLEEANRFSLRKRAIRHNNELYDLILGETLEEACKRLKIKYKKDYEPKPLEEGNLLIYEIK